MTRRTALLAPLLGGLQPRRAKPRWGYILGNELVMGPAPWCEGSTDAVCLLDGKPVRDVFAASEQGWLKRYVRGANGKHLLDDEGRPVVEALEGNVRLESRASLHTKALQQARL